MKILCAALTGMTNILFLLMKFALPVSLSPALSRKRGERSEGGGAGAGSRVASFMLMALCGLATESAYASTWVKAVDSRTSIIFVDTDSINSTGDIVAAWYLRDFNSPMAAEKSSLTYRSAKVLIYYNCSGREIAAAQWITYENKNGSGKVVSNERVNSLVYGEVPPGEAGEAIFDFVCKYAKQHKK